MHILCHISKWRNEIARASFCIVFLKLETHMWLYSWGVITPNVWASWYRAGLLTKFNYRQKGVLGCHFLRRYGICFTPWCMLGAWKVHEKLAHNIFWCLSVATSLAQSHNTAVFTGNMHKNLYFDHTQNQKRCILLVLILSAWYIWFWNGSQNCLPSFPQNCIWI